jgi:hypothetical protein
MKKTFLLSLLMTLAGIFTAGATSVMIDVDKASNVIVQTMSGNGRTLDLYDGMNRFDLSEQDSPLLIQAATGAQIVSVTQNETTAINPSGDGNYRIGISTSGMMIKIVTSGSGSSVTKDVHLDFFASGDDITGKPFAVYYEKDSEWIEPQAEWGQSVIPENASVKIVPESIYEITGCTVPNWNGTLDGALQADGSYVFTNTVPDYYRVQVNMQLKATALKFSITVDYAANVDCWLENQRQGEYEKLTVNDNVKTSFAIDASQNPLEFIPAEGAEIIQVLRNGVAQNATGWGGSNGWVFEVEDGDDFSVSTKGTPTDILIEAPEGNAALDAYIFTRNDGSTVSLSGQSATLTGNLGEMINVSERPGTTIQHIIGSNGAQTNMDNNMRVVKGSDGTHLAKYLIYGSRDMSGVVISVDDASRVSVIQEGGRGDALQLNNGENRFAITDIKNSLAFSATAGNQIVSVTVNGNTVNVNSNGYYMVEAVEGDWIAVTSRKNPVDAVISFNFNEGADITWLTATSAGIPVELSNPMTVKSYTTLTFSAADGYVLEGISCETPGISVSAIEGEGKWVVTIENADVTDAAIDVTMSEMQASEGNSIVVPNGNELFVSYWEMTEKDGVLSETYVKKLANNRVNEVKTGNWIRIYCQDSQSEFESVTVNGVALELERDGDEFIRTVWVEVTGRTVIDAEVVTPCQANTTPTYDDNKHIVVGNVYIEVDGVKYTNVIVHAGQTVKLVAEPETGYVFDHFEKFYSQTMAADGIVLDSDTYTFTQADAAENFILFKGVFKVDENVKVFALRGSTAWAVDNDGKPIQETSGAMGNVVFRLGDGSTSRETTAIEGETVRLEIEVYDEEVANNYEVYGFCLMAGFPNAIIPANYVVSGDDADTDGVIWINGLMRQKGNGVENVTDDSAFRYDASTMTLYAPDTVRIFSASGQLMISTEETLVSVSGLPSGMYIATSGNKTIKFVK